MNSIKIQGKLKKIIAESTRTKEDRPNFSEKSLKKNAEMVCGTMPEIDLSP